jgi:NAD(P)-dependent dehydrogenase (short-subunit alcohol dehydrogenase family)
MDSLELGLRGKVVVLTGASEGLGRACAERFATCGARVAITARRADVLLATAEAIRGATGAEVLAHAGDVTRAADVEAFVGAVLARFGGVDVLVNNAGTSAARGLLEVPDEAWQVDWDLKVMAAVRACRLVVPSMRARGGGAIVNVTTIAGKAPGARSLPTSVTRAAGINLTKSLANELAPDRIRVNTVLLGLAKSAQWERRFGGDDPAERYAAVAKERGVPLGRVGEPEEFADLVAFLASDRARYVTGAGVNFDGGLSSVI